MAQFIENTDQGSQGDMQNEWKKLVKQRVRNAFSTDWLLLPTIFRSLSLTSTLDRYSIHLSTEQLPGRISHPPLPQDGTTDAAHVPKGS